MARTKADRSGQIEQVVRELTPEQETALAALLAGETDQVAAERAGVTRQTVNSWANHDAVFVARLNAERRSLWGAHIDRLRSLIGDAVDVLADDLQGDDPKARRVAALHILRCVGIYGADHRPGGEITPAAVESDWRRASLLEFTF